MEQRPLDRCSVCGAPFVDTGKKQQCRNCGMFANLCCDPQMPLEDCPAPEARRKAPGTDRDAMPSP